MSTGTLNLHNIERFVFRPLFVFFTFCLVLLAIVQASGRFTMYVLPLFEDELNVLLAGQNITLQGVSGQWRGLNPVLEFERLEFPAGAVDAVEVELDLLESMLRSALIARVVRVGQADVHLERRDVGWRLRGMTGPAQDIDVTELLNHGDDLSGYVRVHLHADDGETETIEAHLGLVNRGGVHFADLRLVNSAAPQAQLSAQLWRRETLLFVQQAANAVAASGELLLPRALSGMADLRLAVEDGYWRDVADIGGGALQLAVAGLRANEPSDPLNITFGLKAERVEDQVRAVSSPLTLQAGEDQLVLGPVYVDARVEEDSQLAAAADLLVAEEPGPMLKLWLAELDLGQVGGFVNRHFKDIGAAGRWVKALAAQGQVNNLHAYYDSEQGAGYMASVADLEIQGFNGAPTARNLHGLLWGHQRGLAMQVRGDDAYMQFPDLYQVGWDLAHIQGVVKVWFGNNYFGMQGTHIKARLDDTNVAGGFAITRPQGRYDQRLTLNIYADQVELMKATSFVPYTIPAALAEWVEIGPRAGQLANAQFAYHGQVHQRPGELGRRIELVTDLAAGRVVYEATWPEVYDLEGSVHVAGVDTRVRVASARSMDVEIKRADIVLHDNTTYAAGDLHASGDAAAMLDFVRASPLRETLNFVTPGWQGSGQFDMRGELVIPINPEASPELVADLEFDMDKLTLAMPDYRIVVRELEGSGTFSLPHNLSGDFIGRLFGRPATFKAHHDADWLRFDISGSALPSNVYAILDTDRQVPIKGLFNFDSVLSLAMAGGVTNLALTTDLIGLRVDLPAEFAKAAETPVVGELDVQFLEDYQSVSWRYQDVNGWLHYGDGIERGALGVGGVSPPMTAEEQRAVVIAGYMPKLVLSDWVSVEGDSAVSLPLDWLIQDLQVDEFVIDELAFADLKLNGAQTGDDVSFVFSGDELQGSVSIPGADIMSLDLAYIRLPESDTDFEDHIGAPQTDPITTEVGYSLPAARVDIEQLDIGGEPFGAWRFVIRPEDEQVTFSSFTADVNGVRIDDSTVVWDLAGDRSSFAGSIELDDLEQTLPKWDYAPSLSTDRANVAADVSWAGSPLNMSLLGTDGEIDFVARDGRFIEVESGSGGLRILGLLNFTKVAKRISFDFSDVVGEGLGFEKIDAKVALADGELTFPKRMTVDSSSGKFQVGGRVDLKSGELDNEMIVTLPVSKSLPWYGVYLALANPLAGLGVVVGERVLRKPIEQFSTAKFEVTGTLDDPKVNFVSLWDQSMKAAPEKAEPSGEEEPTAQTPAPAGTALAGDPSLVESPP